MAHEIHQQQNLLKTSPLKEGDRCWLTSVLIQEIFLLPLHSEDIEVAWLLKKAQVAHGGARGEDSLKLSTPSMLILCLYQDTHVFWSQDIQDGGVEFLQPRQIRKCWGVAGDNSIKLQTSFFSNTMAMFATWEVLGCSPHSHNPPRELQEGRHHKRNLWPWVGTDLAIMLPKCFYYLSSKPHETM